MIPDSDQQISSDSGQGQVEGDSSGASDLNSLLSEFQEGTQEAKTETKVVKPDLSRLDPVIKFAEAEMASKQQERVDTDVNAAVEKISQVDEFKHLPKTLTRRMLVAYAVDNDGFNQAFEGRGKDPAAWDAALDKARIDLAGEVKDLTFTESKSDRDDIEAAKATVEGVAAGDSDDSEGPSVAELNKMSDAEWKNYLDEELSKAS